ncbi:hypothetical protein MNBD_ALPHA11-1159 [hydrothermal vent metagenome]|uniref:Uncharacterized protein n=1 Tax=hydrothermal vent metagenome TaxID=652676 RepID=A0A3B0TX22_9ZZZZ
MNWSENIKSTCSLEKENQGNCGLFAPFVALVANPVAP